MPFVEEDLGRLRDGARRAIVESELGPQLLYHLATHTDEAERIAELPELRQIAELGKLETQLTRTSHKTRNATLRTSGRSRSCASSKHSSPGPQKRRPVHRRRLKLCVPGATLPEGSGK